MSTALLMLPALMVSLAVTAMDIEFLQSPENELAVTFSADGNRLWIERRSGVWGSGDGRSQILTATATDAGWGELSPAAFGDARFDEGDPFFDATSGFLYFTSTRTEGKAAEAASGHGNIWRVQLDEEGWGTPQRLPAPVNSDLTEYSPVSRGSRLYFASARNGGELFVTSETANGWTIEPLGPAINSSHGEWNVWVDESENTVLFEGSGRATNITRSGDLYGSRRDDSGQWRPASALAPLNGRGSDLLARGVNGGYLYSTTSPAVDNSRLEWVEKAVVDRALDDVWAFRLLVVNRSSHSLSQLDLARGVITAQHETGFGPHLLAARDDRVAVVSYGVYPRPHDQPVEQMPGWINAVGGQLDVFGQSSWSGRIRCDRPHGTIWNTDGTVLWISCEDRMGVISVDFSVPDPAFQFTATGHPGAHVLAWDEGADQLLVSHTQGGGVAFVDPGTQNSRFVSTGVGSEGLLVLEDHREAWVTVGPSGDLAVLDLDSAEEIERMANVCQFPIDFAEYDEHLWVACFGSHEVVEIDRSARAVLRRIAVPAGPLNIVAHPRLPVLYASMPRRNEVIEIVLEDGVIARRFAVGIEPDGLAIVSKKDQSTSFN